MEQTLTHNVRGPRHRSDGGTLHTLCLASTLAEERVDKGAAILSHNHTPLDKDLIYKGESDQISETLR